MCLHVCMCVHMCVCVMHRPFFLPCAAVGDKQPRGTGSLPPSTHMHSHAHTRVHSPSLTYDSFPSLPVFFRYFLLFHCCQEKTGVNHYRQYRLKMQSPPGVQGHWRPMGGRKSVHTPTCTRSHLTGAACKQCNCRLFAQ